MPNTATELAHTTLLTPNASAASKTFSVPSQLTFRVRSGLASLLTLNVAAKCTTRCASALRMARSTAGRSVTSPLIACTSSAAGLPSTSARYSRFSIRSNTVTRWPASTIAFTA